PTRATPMSAAWTTERTHGCGIHKCLALALTPVSAIPKNFRPKLMGASVCLDPLKNFFAASPRTHTPTPMNTNPHFLFTPGPSTKHGCYFCDMQPKIHECECINPELGPACGNPNFRHYSVVYRR